VVAEAGMSDVVPSRPARRRSVLLSAGPAVVVLLTLSACTSGSGGGSDKPPAGTSPATAHGATDKSDPPSTQAPAPAAVITAAPASGTVISPVHPITVAVADGKLTSVKLLNPEGKSVAGTISADGTSWKNTEELGYSKTYSLAAVAENADGKSATKKSTFTTVTPGNMTMPFLQRPGGYSLDRGATYGVGIVPVVHFDESISDKKAAEKALTVKTTPAVDGSWSWVDDQNVHWRSRSYLPAGTKVTVTAKVYGIQVGAGLYGQADTSTSFKVGASHVAIANDKTHNVKVYFSGKLVRTMPTSMGRGGYVDGKGGLKIALWTMPGTYTVLGHENPATMSSDSYGLPANSPAGYAPEKVYWATKISTDGIYLHELTTTIWAQGNTDVSHGCLNMNTENATWYYQHSLPGDVVKVINTGGPALQVWQNGDWTVPWATWVKGSALH
jgi:lipoprotein-anchoring transpeptidase ErfK/SrfK